MKNEFYAIFTNYFKLEFLDFYIENNKATSFTSTEDDFGIISTIKSVDNKNYAITFVSFTVTSKHDNPTELKLVDEG